MSDAPVQGRASLLTPPGRGAVAAIAAEGPAANAAVDAHFHAANRLQLSAQRIDRILFGHWRDVDAGARALETAGEEVIVCRTSETALEVHCHGGVAASQRILAALAASGCRIEPWTAWLSAHAGSPLEAEADEALAAALTWRTAAILIDQRCGALEQEAAAIVEQLQAGEPASLASARQRLAALCALLPLGRRLTQPWQVAVAGRPNVGKSSLVNALVGYERAIVFDQPGTTRDILAADTAVEGWPIRLTDSAGLRTSDDPLEAAGVALAQERLRQADLVLWVLDAANLPPSDLAAPRGAARRQIETALAAPLSHEPLVVLNKADLVAAVPGSAAIATCALTGAGVPELLAAVAGRLVPSVPASGSAVPFAERHAAILLAARAHLEAANVADAVTALRALTTRE